MHTEGVMTEDKRRELHNRKQLTGTLVLLPQKMQNCTETALTVNLNGCLCLEKRKGKEKIRIEIIIFFRGKSNLEL